MSMQVSRSPSTRLPQPPSSVHVVCRPHSDAISIRHHWFTYGACGMRARPSGSGDAEPGDGSSVAAVAARWGFTHLGRFAIEYRRRFGVHPSQTLRS